MATRYYISLPDGTRARGADPDLSFKAVSADGFASELHDSILRINQMKQASDAKLAAFQAGDPNVALNDVMVDMQKASVAFEMGVQVRNRLVTAYKDIMNMQV